MNVTETLWLKKPGLLVTLFLAAASCLTPETVLAQRTIAAPDVFAPPDARMRQSMRAVEKLLSDRDYGQTVQFLQRIIENDDDYFQPDTGLSYKTAAAQLLGQLPSEGLEAYELRYGSSAEKMVRSAVAAGDFGLLETAFRRYFHTQAGYRAAFLLGQSHMDHGRPLAALQCFGRLKRSPSAAAFEPMLSFHIAACWRRAGRTELAEEAILRRRELQPGARVSVFDRTVPFARNRARVLPWLAGLTGGMNVRAALDHKDWLMPGGNPARTAVGSGGAPFLRHRWEIPTSNDPSVLELIAELQLAFRDQGLTALPSGQPLIVGSLVLSRTADSLLAIDLKNGKRLWSVTDLENPADTAAFNTAEALEQRLWNDLAYGMIASNGKSVFLVQGLQWGGSLSRSTLPPFGRIGATRPRTSSNRIQAYDLMRSEGKALWEIGGADGGDEPALAGAFFLGPPLPLEGLLYTLVEIKGEIRLVTLDAATGRQRWTQALAVVDTDIRSEARRRLAGVTPSYADGVLVCTTSSSAVVGVDLTTRTLRWGYKYGRTQPARPPTRINLLRQSMLGRTARALDHWADTTAIIAGGRIVLTPAESDKLHCLNLIDGKTAWDPIAREDGLYVACIHANNIIVVGRSGIRAVSLKTGESAWPQALVLPKGSGPSGRGFVSEGQYYLPLTSAEVAVIDLDDGKIVRRIASGNGQVLGNLVCREGRVVSQQGDAVACFLQQDYAQRLVQDGLKKNPDDPDVLALEAELLLEEGRLDDAIARLRRSYQSLPDPHTGDLLAESLMRGLRDNFKANRRSAKEVQGLLETQAQQVEFFRLMATGLHEAGDDLEAFDYYLRLADSYWRDGTTERVEDNLTVRRDRWIGARFAALYDEGSAEVRAKIDDRIRELLDEVDSSQGAESLRQFLGYFGRHPRADEARERLVARLDPSVDLLETELLLRQLEQSQTGGVRASAAAQLANLYRSAGRPANAALYFKRLAADYSDEVCLDGKTGRQLLEGIPADDEVRRFLTRTKRSWPSGKVDVGSQPKSGTTYRATAFDLEAAGSLASVDTIHWDQQRRLLFGRDKTGRQRWKLPLANTNQRVYYGSSNVRNAARAFGHVVLVSLGHELFAIDTLGSRGQPRVLWKQRLNETVPGVQQRTSYSVRTRMVRMPWGVQRFYVTDNYGRPLGLLGPLNGELACFQRGRDLVAVDPRTGGELWKRRGLQAGSRLFGDDEILFVAGPDQTEAVVLRAHDGHQLGKREIPRSDQMIATFGRKVLTWSADNGKIQVALRDVWSDKTAWKHSFDLNAKAALIHRESLGVLEPDGRFVVINLADGKLQVDTRVQPEASLSGIYVLRSAEQYLLITNRPRKPDPNISSVNAISGGVVINGRAYGFDRKTGRRTWARDILSQGLLLDQPDDVPILVFACHQYRRTAGNRRTYYLSVLCLDRRNGRIVHQQDAPGTIGYYEVKGDAESSTVQVDLARTVLMLRLTDEPRPNKPEIEAKQEKAEKRPAEENQKAPPSDSPKLPNDPTRNKNG